MTSARSLIVDLDATPYYHCIARCVRRAFLYGKDSQTGQDFSYRKQWIVNRIKQLANIFAIKPCAYAVMNNHYHLVLFVNEKQANTWDETEILKRWEELFPADAKNLRDSILPTEVMQKRLDIIRHRLKSLSWFMRCLNEVIARLSNKEEGVTGRFWEGRFKSQALLDEGAVLAAMAYVDLNPIRAKVASTPEESEFTSIHERINAISEQLKQNTQSSIDDTQQPLDLIKLSKIDTKKYCSPQIDFSLSDYLELVDCTGRILREDKKGAIPDKLMPILYRLHLTPNGWLNMTSKLEEKFFDAIGNPMALLNFKNLSKGHPKGLKTLKQYYQNAA